MKADRLRGARLKIKRAHKHIAELQEAVNAFIKRDACRLMVYEDQNTGARRWEIRLFEEPPEELPLIIGDAVHNLRSALDLMACDLVRANGGNVNHVNFPFARDVDSLPKALKDAHIKRAGITVLKLVEEMQPYYGGNGEQLALLHDLDIMDKHRLVLPVFNVVRIVAGETDATDSVFDPGPPMWSGRTSAVSLKDGLDFESDTSHPRLKDIDEIQPSFDVAFGEGPFEREAVVPTLLQLAEFVAGVIDAFGAL